MVDLLFSVPPFHRAGQTAILKNARISSPLSPPTLYFLNLLSQAPDLFDLQVFLKCRLLICDSSPLYLPVSILYL